MQVEKNGNIENTANNLENFNPLKSNDIAKTITTTSVHAKYINMIVIFSIIDKLALFICLPPFPEESISLYCVFVYRRIEHPIRMLFVLSIIVNA